jgi:signal transduction histidine kinase
VTAHAAHDPDTLDLAALDRRLPDERALAAEAAHRLSNPLTAARLRLEDLARWDGMPGAIVTELRCVAADIRRVGDELTSLLHERADAVEIAWTTGVRDLVERAAVRWGERLLPERRTVQLELLETAYVAAPPVAVARLLDALFAEVVAASDGDVRVHLLVTPTFLRLQLRAAATTADGAQPVGRDEVALTAAQARVQVLGGRWVATSAGEAGVDVLLPARPAPTIRRG